MTPCALAGGKLSTQINVSEACENERGCLCVLISFLYRYFIIVDDTIGGAVFVRDVWVDDIGRFLSGLGRLIGEHLLSVEV